MDNFDKSIMYRGMRNLQRDCFGNPLHEGDMVVEISRMLLITKREDNGMIILRNHEGNLIKIEINKLLKIDKKSLVIEKDRNNKDIHIGDLVKIAPKEEIFRVNDFKRYSSGTWIYLINIDGSFKSGAYRGECLEVVEESDVVIQDMKEAFVKFAEATLKIEIDVPVEKEKSKLDEMKEIINKMQNLR